MLLLESLFIDYLKQKRYMLRVLLFFFLLCYSLFASNLHIKSENTTNKFVMHYFNDDTSALSIEDIVKQEFIQTSKNNFNLGYKKGSIWFKIIVENRSDTEAFILTLNEHFYEKANLYYENNENTEKLSNSLFTPVSKREVKSNKLAFEIKLPQNQPQTFYLELKGKYAYFGKVEILEKEYFYLKESHGLNLAFMFALGIIFMLIFFTFFLYSKTKEKIYLYYVGYSFFMLLYFINITGLLVYLNLQIYIYKFQLTASFMMGFLVLFSKEYLQTKKYLPKVDTLLILLTLLFFVIGVLIFYSYQPWNMILNNSVGLVCILLIIISVVVYFKGHLQSKYYTLAMMLYLVSVVLFTFMIKGHFEYSLMTRYGFVIGIIIEMLLFSYLLANRYDLSKQSVQNYLEAEVKQQTKELNFLVEERELLLKEVFHRVKNNFHMLIAMLYLEKEKTQIDFIGLINRVKSMSMIHEYLYSNKNLSYIDTDSYIENLIQNLQNSYPKVSITFESQNFALNFDHALSLGIIINEVLTNAIKHNPNNENIILHIQLYKKNSTNSVHLSIKDNGKEFKNQNSKGLGLKLINQFCKKLPNCQSSFSYDKGVKFELYFDIKGNLGKS